MQIIMIKPYEGKLTAIMDSGEGVTLDMIDGSPRIGCNVIESGDRWAVNGNNVDSDCVGGACDISTDIRLDK